MPNCKNVKSIEYELLFFDLSQWNSFRKIKSAFLKNKKPHNYLNSIPLDTKIIKLRIH